MNWIDEIKQLIPDYAKDIRLNIGQVLTHSALSPESAAAVALAAAFAAKSQRLVTLVRQADDLSETHANAALTAAALMAMNNVWYPYVEMAGDAELQSQQPSLRMMAYANHGGVDQKAFEMYVLAASIVGRCTHCVRSHFAQLKAAGVDIAELRDVGRIAAVVHATALVLAQADEL